MLWANRFQWPHPRFFNKAKPDHLKEKVLMLDARNVYRKVSRKIYDFSPEQLANLTSIVWLYRGEQERFLAYDRRMWRRSTVWRKMQRPSDLPK